MTNNEREKHKYVAKVKLKGSTSKKPKYRYFYTKEEYAAYLNDKKKSKDKKNSKDSVLSLLDNGKSQIEKLIKSTNKNISKSAKKSINKIEKTIDKLEKNVDKLGTDINKKSKKTIDKLEKNVNKLGIDINKKSKKTIDKLEKNVNTLKNAVIKSIKELSSIGSKEVDKSLTKIGSDNVDKLETMKDRAVNIGRTVISTIMSKTGSQKLHDTVVNKFNEFTQPVKEFSDLKKKDAKDKKQSDEEDMIEINQNYETGMYEYTNNCAYCTMAYEMRQRGYDVEANPIGYPSGNDIQEIMSWYEGVDPYSIEITDSDTASKTLEKELLNMYPEGSRGQFCLYWNAGGGHSVAWEIVDGDVVLRDCQSNEVVDTKDYMQYANSVYLFRTDNLKISKKALKCVRNR